MITYWSKQDLSASSYNESSSEWPMVPLARLMGFTVHVRHWASGEFLIKLSLIEDLEHNQSLFYFGIIM